MRRWRGGGLLATWLAVGAVTGCGERNDDVEPVQAPAYETHTLAGEPVSLEDLRGDVVLLNVWATWCIPCRREIPVLEGLHQELGPRGLRVVGVTVDSRRAEDDIHRFIEQLEMTYDVWWDPDQTVLARFEAYAVPLTVLVDRAGRVTWRHLGEFHEGDPALMRALDEALAP